MKTKLILILIDLFLLSSLLFATDTITCKYFPLAVGNVYKYHFGTSSGGGSYTYKIRIIKDTIINDKKYYEFTPLQFEPYSSRPLMRFDTLTGNIYYRGSCSYNQFDVLHDSLKSNVNDLATICYSTATHRCNFIGYYTVLGNIVHTKRFKRGENPPSDYTEFEYAAGFGIVGVNYQIGNDMASHYLLGCYINGVLYGDTTLTSINVISDIIPQSFALLQNYPNPFNPVTKIKFDISAKSVGQTFLSVYDIQGREVATLVNEKLQPGTYEVTFDGSNLPSGVYFYQLRTGDFTATKKLILLK